MGNTLSLSSGYLKEIQEVVSGLFGNYSTITGSHSVVRELFENYNKTTGSHSDATNKSIKVKEFLDSLIKVKEFLDYLYEQIDQNTVPFFQDDLGTVTVSEFLKECCDSGDEFQGKLIAEPSEEQKSSLQKSFSKFNKWLSEIQQSLIFSENNDIKVDCEVAVNQNFLDHESSESSYARFLYSSNHGTFFRDSDNSGSSDGYFCFSLPN